MASISVSIDVPKLEKGIEFYTRAFGFKYSFSPVPGVAILDAGDSTLCLLEKKSGSKPSPKTKDLRRYRRHWTPVHLDIHVKNLKSALKKAVAAGAKKELVFEHEGHGSAAFCSDPFGHGFCLIED
jgi:uncharacterized glyoxalase superfamily protein PhnB